MMYAAKGKLDLSKYDGQKIEYGDWVPEGIQSPTWDVSYDRRGRAGWEKNYFPYAGRKNRAIEVVTKQASRNYLAFLQSMEIPYLVCGEREINLAESLGKLKKYFDIKTMVLGGGALINGAFLKAGLVDQISLVIAPYISGDSKKKGTFDTLGKFVNQRFHVTQTKKLGDGGVHLIYDRD